MQDQHIARVGDVALAGRGELPDNVNVRAFGARRVKPGLAESNGFGAFGLLIVNKENLGGLSAKHWSMCRGFINLLGAGSASFILVVAFEDTGNEVALYGSSIAVSLHILSRSIIYL